MTVSSAPERLAAIDVGSNSIRLLVAEHDPQSGLHVIDEVKDQPRLATGLAATGRLDELAMARALIVLQRMREVAERRGVKRISAVATSAVREAENGEAFVAQVNKELGIPLRIIDPETEATLSYRSVAHHFPLSNTRALIADIGGGSLELIGAVNGLVELTVSLPLGAVRLTEVDLPGKRDTRKEITGLRSLIRKQLRKAAPWRKFAHATVIGSGGTFTNLGRMVVARRGLPVGQPVHGETVTTAEVEQLLEWLSTKTAEQRRNVPGLNPQRADIILAGLAVTAELLDLADARELRVSAYGLREGLLLEMIGEKVAPATDPLRQMREFVERCQGDRRHVEQVRVLALSLFDHLADSLGAKPDERAILEAASLLHDVGQVVSYRKHHKHSFELIMHADRLNFGVRERTLVALLSRYHRKRGPNKRHRDFVGLDRADRDIVRRLSGVLRVADGLDRGHTSIVDHVRARLTQNRLTLRVVPRYAGADVSLECWGAARKANVLEKVLGRRIIIAPAL